MKTLSLTYGPVPKGSGLDASPKQCVGEKCPVGESAFQCMKKLDSQDTTLLHCGIQCAQCQRWINVTHFTTPADAPLPN